MCTPFSRRHRRLQRSTVYPAFAVEMPAGGAGLAERDASAPDKVVVTPTPQFRERSLPPNRLAICGKRPSFSTAHRPGLVLSSAGVHLSTKWPTGSLGGMVCGGRDASTGTTAKCLRPRGPVNRLSARCSAKPGRVAASRSGAYSVLWLMPASDTRARGAAPRRPASCWKGTDKKGSSQTSL